MKELKETILGPKEIAEILPHRYPFLLVDRVVYLNLDESKIIGQKNVTINESFFQGHFPGVPILPGVLILEALAQTGGILVYKKGYQKKIAVLLNVTNAKFRYPVFPGDILSLHVRGLHISNQGGKIEAHAKVDDRVVVEAGLSFALIDKAQLIS